MYNVTLLFYNLVLPGFVRRGWRWCFESRARAAVARASFLALKYGRPPVEYAVLGL